MTDRNSINGPILDYTQVPDSSTSTGQGSPSGQDQTDSGNAHQVGLTTEFIIGSIAIITLHGPQQVPDSIVSPPSTTSRSPPFTPRSSPEIPISENIPVGYRIYILS